jgi:hypothetical protein
MVQRVIILKLVLQRPVPLAALRRRSWPLGYWDRGFVFVFLRCVVCVGQQADHSSESNQM